MSNYNKCDHKSVGLIVFDSKDRILLIERKNYPVAIAPPAGHLDGKSFKAAAKDELLHETGLEARKIKLLLKSFEENPCRRAGGFDHDWKVFLVEEYEGEIKPSTFEARKVFWATREELQRLAERTKKFARKCDVLLDNMILLTGKLAEDKEWKENPGLEPVWCFLFYEMGYINL